MSKVLPIISYNNPILRKKSKEILSIGSEIKQLSDDMIATMKYANGIGLAGNQVAKDLRIFVIDVNEESSFFSNKEFKKNILYKKMPLAIINPVIEEYSQETSICSEGCLSISNIYIDIERPIGIKLAGQFIDGEKFSNIDCQGMLSRCIQHEYDHLEGILFIDRISKKQYKKIEKKLVKIAINEKDCS